jgi:hypothetical protein
MQTRVADLQGYFAHAGQTAPDEWGVWLYSPNMEQGDEIVMGLTFQDALAVIMRFTRRGARMGIDVGTDVVEDATDAG